MALLLIVAILFGTYYLSFAETNLTLQSEGSVLMDYDTGKILYDKNMDKVLFPASTTKIMTAILAIENGNLDDIVTVDQEAVSLTQGSHIALEPGEKLTLEQLLYALLVQSANDSAFAIAKHVSGSIEGFVQLMNDKAKEIGAKNTHFVNPNGLHDESHVTTAHDLALIGQYAMNNEVFRKFVNTTKYTIGPTNKKTEARYLWNTNNLLAGSALINVDGVNVPYKYEGASGIKTGTTGQAGNCLVSFAERDGQRLIAVVLKAQGEANLYSDIHKLLNYGFSAFDNAVIVHKNEFVDNIQIEDGKQQYVAGIMDKDFTYPVAAGSQEKIERKIVLKEDLKAPVKKGEVLGVTEFYLDGENIGKGDIISTLDVEVDPSSKLIFKILSKWYLFLIFGTVVLRVQFLKRKKRRRIRRSSYSMRY